MSAANWIGLFLRFVLGTVFLLAGISKFSRSARFEKVVRDYRLLPDALILPTARWLPRLEILGGSLFLLGVGLSLVSLASASLLLMFSIAMGINLLRGRQIDCGCLGVGGQHRIRWPSVIRNVCLALAALWLAASTPTGHRQAESTTLDALAVAITATVVVFGTLLMSENRRLVRDSETLRNRVPSA